MKATKVQSSLKDAIARLEFKQKTEWLVLKIEFYETVNSLKPLNILKATLDEVVHEPRLKQQIAAGITGLAAGYVSKMVIIGKSKNPIKKMIGSILQLLVSTLVANKPEVVVALVNPIRNLLLGDKQPENSEN